MGRATTTAATGDGGIELLRPNEAAFGTAGAGGFIDVDDDLPPDAFDEEPRPRWTMAVAGLLVTGLLAGGIIAAAPWAGDETATPPTTSPPSTTTTTTTPTPRTTVPRDPLAGIPTEPAGWVIGTGGFWQFGGALSYGTDDGPTRTGSRIDLWAERDATRTDGPWLSVVSQPYANGQLVADGVRTVFGDRRGVISIDTEGVTHVVVDLGATGPTLLIDSVGLGLDQIAALAAGAEAPERFDGEDPIHYGDLRSRSGVLGLPLRLSRSAGYSPAIVLGVPLAASYWYQGAGSTLAVEVWSIDQRTLAALPLVLEPVEIPPQWQPMVDELTAVGRDVRVFRSAEPQASTMVTWFEGDQLVTLTGAGPTATLAELLVAARSARLAGDSEWHDLLVQSQQGIDGGSFEPEAYMLQTGEFADDGGNWDATLSGSWFWMNGPNAGWYSSVELGDQPTVQRFVAPNVTVWVGVDPTGVAVTMRVTAAGEAPIDVSMEPFGNGTAAFHPRQVDVAATVELLDASGAMVLSTAG